MIEAIKDKFVPSLSSDAEDHPLPDYAILYFEHLAGEYDSLPATVFDPDTKVIADGISRREKNQLTWRDLYTFDLILTRKLPAEKLSRRIWSLRSRYRDVAGLKEYEAYLASKPPDLATVTEAESKEGESTKEKELRADIEYLLGELYLRYAIMPIREKIRDNITKKIAVYMLVAIAVVVLSLYGAFTASPKGIIPVEMATVMIVIFSGAVGGLVSMQQRYQSVPSEGDQIDSVSELAQGFLTTFTPLFSGAIFALILFFLVVAGLLKGGLFPEVGLSGSSVKITSFVDFVQSISPAKPIDYAKLVIWSFIAGFAERFVPDTLTRFLQRREAEGGAKS